MKFLALIQARCSSTRLPNKVLMDLGGKPALQHVIDRVQKSKYIDEVMVITSIDKENMQIVKLCCDLGIRVFLGSEDDVLDRYYQAAKLMNTEYVIRITGDCPLYDSNMLDLAIEGMHDADYCCDFSESLPDGLDIEILKFEALKISWQQATLGYEREHVTQYIKKNPQLFEFADFQCPIKGIGNKRWTLDEQNDYELLSAIFKHFSKLKNNDFYTQDILDFLADRPDLEKLNSSISRNEGLAISIANNSYSK